MRNILLIAFVFSGLYVNAQINGNKNIVTRSYEIGQFESIYLGLYAQYEIDMEIESSFEITIDENLLPFVEKVVKDGEFVINQLKWISPSVDPVIKVGARGLQKITQSAHSRTNVKNIDQEELEIVAEVGDVFLEGKVHKISIMVGTADVDASDLFALKGDFIFESWGTIIANVSGDYKTDNGSDGKLTLNGEIDEKVADERIRFMKFVLRNNSANRHQFYVIGPKPDGSKFSYGFPMMPYQKRDKDWTNGTKVYKVNNLGVRKLVKIIESGDEGTVVNVFEK